MHRLQVIYDGLQQYKPGEIEGEPPAVQQAYKTEVSLGQSGWLCVWGSYVALLLPYFFIPPNQLSKAAMYITTSLV